MTTQWLGACGLQDPTGYKWELIQRPDHKKDPMLHVIIVVPAFLPVLSCVPVPFPGSDGSSLDICSHTTDVDIDRCA